MADLMNGVSSYSELANKYANFITPAVRIKVGGNDVAAGGGLVIYELKMDLSVDTAGCVSIKFADLYDIKQHSFSSRVKDLFKPGTIVEVEMGYLSTTECLFKGYVEMVGACIGERDFFWVTLMDVKRLMMTSGKRNILYEEKNYSDIFGRVMSDYSSLCSMQIEETSDKLESPVSQMGTDYDFIMRDLILRGRVNREFIVLAGKAYFREPEKNTSPLMKLSYGRELKFLSVNHTYRDMEINVTGVNEHQEIVEGISAVKGNLSQSKLRETPVDMVADPLADTTDKAEIRARAAAFRQRKRGCIGYGMTIGIPEIVAGRYIEVENTDEMLNKKYYLTQVRHSYTRKGYVTEFEIGGCL